jgi:hypothetical protein
MEPLDLSAFCFKTFSPFFSSQERLTQNRLDGNTLVRSCDLPVNPLFPASFGWTLHGLDVPNTSRHKSFQGLNPGAAIFKAYQGSAYLMIVGPPGVSAGGNGWVPCTHLGGPKRLVEKSGGGRIVFWLGDFDGAKKYLKYE